MLGFIISIICLSAGIFDIFFFNQEMEGIQLLFVSALFYIGYAIWLHDARRKDE